MDIYVRLLDEDVDVWRPVAAEPVSGGVYRLASADPPPDESWEFPPGAVVRCELKRLSGGDSWIAIALSDEPGSRDIGRR